MAGPALRQKGRAEENRQGDQVRLFARLSRAPEGAHAFDEVHHRARRTLKDASTPAPAGRDSRKVGASPRWANASRMRSTAGASGSAMVSSSRPSS
jgi:hypothetical protein